MKTLKLLINSAKFIESETEIKWADGPKRQKPSFKRLISDKPGLLANAVGCLAGEIPVRICWDEQTKDRLRGYKDVKWATANECTELYKQVYLSKVTIKYSSCVDQIKTQQASDNRNNTETVGRRLLPDARKCSEIAGLSPEMFVKIISDAKHERHLEILDIASRNRKNSDGDDYLAGSLKTAHFWVDKSGINKNINSRCKAPMLAVVYDAEIEIEVSDDDYWKIVRGKGFTSFGSGTIEVM